MHIYPTAPFYFHATPLINRYVVNHQGLKVSLDARKKGRIWLASISEIPYVCDHLTARNGNTLAFFAVFQIHRQICGFPFKSCGRPGIFYVEHDVPERACEYVYTHMSWLDSADFGM